MKKQPQNLYVEASVLAQARISGIGHNALEIVRALGLNTPVNGIARIVLIVPWRSRSHVADRDFGDVDIRYFMVPMKILVILDKFHIAPRLDWFYGRGNYLFPNYLNLPVTKNSKILTYIHDLSFIKCPEFVSPRNRKYLQSNIKRWAMRSTKILTISDYSKMEIAQTLNIETNNITMVSCGVDHSAFYHRTAGEVKKVLEEYSISAWNYYLYVGNIEPRKNILGILTAYESLAPDTQNKHPLVLVGGSGWLNEDIQVKIKQLQAKGLKVIQPKSYLEDDDLPAIYSGASALVHPAYYEGFGLSLLQAMSCQTPIITSTTTSMPEVVRDCAILVTPGNHEELVEAMEKVVEDVPLRNKMKKKGLTRSKQYTWSIAAKRLAVAIQES